MHLIDELFDLCNSHQRSIITIDGPAGAGKTTLAGHISAALAARLPATVIHMDDLYHGWNSPFDDNFESALKSITSAHLANKKLQIRKYDWNSSSYRDVEEMKSERLLILEGCGAMHRVIDDLTTASIWLDIDPLVGRERVLGRDGFGISDEMTQWLALQSQHFAIHEPSLRADYLLTT